MLCDPKEKKGAVVSRSGLQCLYSRAIKRYLRRGLAREGNKTQQLVAKEAFVHLEI